MTSQFLYPGSLYKSFPDVENGIVLRTCETNKAFHNFDFDSNPDWPHVELILKGLELEKYCEIFKNLNISLETFLNLNDSDLTAIGITDTNDKSIILKNIEGYKNNCDKYDISENHSEDLIIAKNVYSQLVRLQKYAALLEYQWIKEIYLDYEGDQEFPPSECLKMFSKAALEQCDNMIDNLYKEEDSDNLIDIVLKVNNMTLPKYLQNKFKKKKWKNLSKFMKSAAVYTGISILVLVTIKYFKAKRG